MSRSPHAGVPPRARRVFVLWLGVLLGLALPSANAYVLSGERWPSDQPVVMHLGLGSPSKSLIDGSTSWNQVAEAALAIWNPYLGSGVQFQASDATNNPAERDRVNSVFFDKTIYGEDFGADTLAITLTFYSGTTHIKSEADVVVNSAKQFDSYRGSLRYDNQGRHIDDLRRVLIHEFGHVLGLEHTPQGSYSIMAPAITDIDSVQSDDIAGVQAIYGKPVVLPVITSNLTAGGAVGVAFSYRITATGSATTFQAGGLPEGLIVNATSGLITGTPATDGTFDVTLSATNSAGTGTAVLVLTIGDAPVITSSSTATAVYGRPFLYQITASNQPTGLTANFLPSGLSLDKATGIISGTPKSAGLFTVSIRADNASGSTSATLTLTVVLDPGIVTVHGFHLADGSVPTALLQATDGNFYGTTAGGGANGDGTIFKMTPDGTLTTLYSFSKTFVYSIFSRPISLMQAADGNFYCVSVNGGASDGGAVFKMTPDGTVTVLHSFDASIEGFAPSAGLVQGQDGNLYGSTSRGGALGAGSFFRLTPDGTLTILADQGGVAGNTPSTLIQAADGNFYGTMSSGGASGGGTVFRLTADGAVTVVHSFSGAEGWTPAGPLVEGEDGLFYGSLGAGGNNNSGTIYRMTPAGEVNLIHVFAGTDGTTPSSLMQGNDGNFYGTTVGGGYVDGQGGDGTVFEVTPEGEFTTLHIFSAGDGDRPSPLIQAADGEFYGVTPSTEDFGTVGTIFRTTLHDPVATLPTVTLTATTPQVTLGSGEAGVFTLTLSAPQAADTFVNYTVKGSAANGTDYVFLKGKAKIKAGKISKSIKVVPQGDPGGASKKVVTLVLAPGDGYTVANTGKVKVKILPAP